MTDPTSIGGVTYHVTTQTVATAAANTRTTAADIATIITDVRSYVVSLEDSWGGVSANRFQELMTDYDIFARMLQDALEGIAKGLEGTYVNYHDSEAANLASLEGIDLGTPPALFS
jgi:WXG100 family type VII secretion target